eukprot:7929683-Heterocapsa_arctica.AAC.1
MAKTPQLRQPRSATPSPRRVSTRSFKLACWSSSMPQQEWQPGDPRRLPLSSQAPPPQRPRARSSRRT